MITEDYVSFEVAKLLKDKGFDEHCFCINYPLPEEGHHSIILPNLLNNSMIPFINEYKFCRYKEDFITIPTLQMAMKWLRIVHNIHIEPHIVRTERSYGYMPNYIDLKELKQHFPFDEFDFSNADKYACITYDKACETTIKYCLENLI